MSHLEEEEKVGMESTPERLLGEEETEKEGVMREKPEKADLSKELNKVVKVNESVLVEDVDNDDDLELAGIQVALQVEKDPNNYLK